MAFCIVVERGVESSGSETGGVDGALLHLLWAFLDRLPFGYMPSALGLCWAEDPTLEERDA